MAALRTGFHLIGKNIVKTVSTLANNKGKLLAFVCVRSVSTQPITKNIYLVSNEKKKFDQENFIIPTSDDKPLVVILTWLLAKQKHINKFNKIYLEQGFDVLNVGVSPWQILWPTKGSQIVARDLVRFLDNNHCYSPMLLHGFSVAGYVWGEVMVSLMQERYKHILERIRGQIWDSAADITEIPIGLPKAVFPKNAILETALRQYILYHMKTFHKVATCHYIRSSQMFHTTVVKAPALFLLSKSDPVGAFRSNERVKDSWVSMGMEVRWKCWDKSPHVSHFYYHPKEYMEELYDFLDKLDLVSHPERKQLKI